MQLFTDPKPKNCERERERETIEQGTKYKVQEIISSLIKGQIQIFFFWIRLFFSSSIPLTFRIVIRSDIKTNKKIVESWHMSTVDSRTTQPSTKFTSRMTKWNKNVWFAIYAEYCTKAKKEKIGTETLI